MVVSAFSDGEVAYAPLEGQLTRKVHPPVRIDYDFGVWLTGGDGGGQFQGAGQVAAGRLNLQIFQPLIKLAFILAG